MSIAPAATPMHYELRALDADRGLVSLRLDAADEQQARRLARERGLEVVSLRARGGAGGTGGWRRRTAFPLLSFTQELVSLSAAGLSLPETLDAMVERETRPEVRATLVALRGAIQEGRSFSQALAAQPAVFGELYVATVRASERSGDLAESLRRYIDYHERLDAVRKKVVSASIYPVVLLAVGGLVTLFLLGYVVPRFSALYADGGRELPWMSRLLLQWGQLLNDHGAALAGVAAVLAVAAVLGAGRARLGLAALLSRVPQWQARRLVYHLARFYRTLGMLLRGGTPLVPALAMTAGLLPPELQAALAQATRRIREGVSLSQAMADSGLTTPVASRMLRVGERSGDMAGMMERIAAFHDEELARWVEWFTKLFEPLLMALIGVVIGAIVVLMYLPIFELAGSLQ